jgi:hypothetical protein
MKKSAQKPFTDWQAEEVEEAFGIKKLRTLPFLDHIKTLRLAANHPLRTSIEKYRLRAFDLIDGWNEDEYKFFFISMYLDLVDFHNEALHYNVFTQRPMSVEYDNGNKKTSGKVEWMLARGRQIPKEPHFFLHEYKPEKNRDNDPLGQVLIAMIAAQTINKDDKPIYGIYVNGRNWFVVVLQGKQYAVSDPFAITTEDVFSLFAVLEHLRDMMDGIYKPLT